MKASVKNFVITNYKCFTRVPNLSLSQFDIYLAAFYCLDVKVPWTEDDIWEVLQKVKTDKTPGLDRHLYEMYLRMLYMFISLLTLIYNNWMKHRRV